MTTPVGTIPFALLSEINPAQVCSFRIPDYQRGYRWKREDVIGLLEDLNEFIEEGEQGRPFYCLQPLVVKREQDNAWAVVDGQQRLTTLFLISQVLQQAAPYALSYSTRPRSKDFLDEIAVKKEGDITNIDFHHIYYAHLAIQSWFQDQAQKEGFTRLLADTKPEGRNVRFIWYEIGEEDQVAAFTRLNVGKIPLTDEELIRALFLRRLGKGHLADSAFQHRLALEWDRIETALQAPDFWGFLCRESPPEGSRIRLLLELCAPAGQAKADRGIFHHFENKLKNATAEQLRKVWQEIVSRFEQLEEWHKDPLSFHLVGILATLMGDGSTALLRTLLDDASKISKSAFVNKLRQRIRAKLVGGSPSIEAFIENLDYDENAKAVRSTLAIFNIATLLKRPGVPMRFPFHLYHDPETGWDIEHVQSQSGEGLGDEKRQGEWLKACAVELQKESTTKAMTMLDAIQRFLDKETDVPFEDLAKSIRECFDESDSVEGLHGLGNLTLLDRTTNRAYGNAPFVVKRSKILKAEQKGRLVLPCTRDLFLKVFGENPGNLRRWDLETDGKAHESAICRTLKEFFEGTEGAVA